MWTLSSFLKLNMCFGETRNISNEDLDRMILERILDLQWCFVRWEDPRDLGTSLNISNDENWLFVMSIVCNFARILGKINLDGVSQRKVPGGVCRLQGIKDDRVQKFWKASFMMCYSTPMVICLWSPTWASLLQKDCYKKIECIGLAFSFNYHFFLLFILVLDKKRTQ
jgi:hypothetical protein